MANPADIQATFALGLQHHRAGDLREAQRLYQQVLASSADHADALHLLGVIDSQEGRQEQALERIGRAIALNPAGAGDYYSNYGLALAALGRYDQAIAAYRRALAMRPNLAAAHSNLAKSLLATGERDQAIAEFAAAIRLQPDFSEPHNELGRLLLEANRLEEAIRVLDRALQLQPNSAEAAHNLGNALFRKGNHVMSAAAYARAVRIRPDLVESHINLGKSLNLLERIDEAIESFKRALALRPGDVNALNAMGNAYKDIARLPEALRCYQRVVELDPANVVADSNRVYAMYFDPAYSGPDVLRQAKVWNQRHAPAAGAALVRREHDRSPDRRLRIGYVSPNFRNHCQSLFMPPLLSKHDHEQFEIFCYADLIRPDRVTEGLRRCADVWRSTSDLSDRALAEMVSADQIDILIDLTMHMGEGRLSAFALKPAPVQVAWLAYTGTTGVAAIDYRLSDPYLDPPGENDDHYSEQTIRLRHTFWCYDPMGMELEAGAPPMPGELPAARNGYVTFGCLNNFSKINDGVLEVWSRVMSATSASRLLLLAPPGSARAGVIEKMGRHGIDAARIEFVGRQSRSRYLNEFHRIDLCLDTMPCNGHTTSLDSAWMGVPVVSRVGRTAMGRAGWSQLSNLGLRELAATTDDEFVRIAVELAGDTPRLSELRRTLRGRLENSPIMDGPGFARDVEAAYRRMWTLWVNQTGSA